MYKFEIYKYSKICKNINLNKCTIKGHKDKGRIRLLDKSPCVKITYFYPPALTVITEHSSHAYKCNLKCLRLRTVLRLIQKKKL